MGTPTKALQGVVILDPLRYAATAADGSTTTGSSDVSAPDINLSSADLGAYLYGPNIPDGDTIVSVISPTQAVLAVPATATASNSAFIVGLTIESPPAPNAFIQPRGSPSTARATSGSQIRATAASMSSTPTAAAW